MAFLNNNGTQPLLHALESLRGKLSHDDFLLLPLVILGSVYIFNCGSIIPKKDPYDYMWFERPQADAAACVQSEKRSRKAADIVRQRDADLIIFWGSQSGTAEGYAHRLARESHQRYKLVAVVADLADYDAETIAAIPSATLAIFIMSTYGEGDPSDNAQDFISWTRSNPDVNLSHLKIAAFGCGNSNYRYFNKTIEEAVNSLLKLGAIPFTPTGKGDEATRTTEEDFVEWKERLLSTLCLEHELTEAETAYEPEVEVIKGEYVPQRDLQLGTPFQKAGTKLSATTTAIVPVPVTQRTCLSRYSAPGRSVIEVKIDLTAHPHIKYKTGDHIAVWPENAAQEVESLIAILGLQDERSKPIRISSVSANKELEVPASTTIEALFCHYLEISGPVSRETILAVARVAPSAAIRDGLSAIGKDRETYALFLESDYFTFSRLLALGCGMDSSASWHELPLSFVIDNIPRMQPRLYSISSSRIVSPRQVSLTVSVKPSLISGRPDISIPGITSSFLANTRDSDDTVARRSNLYVQIRESTFKLPATDNTPLVMVAAGTGIAPFRAFIQEKARIASIGKQVGKLILFFGCQADSDYLYADELRELSTSSLAGKLKLVVAFSRAGAQKVYVQDRVRQEQQEVLQLLCEQDAAFYICGASTMAKEVGNTLSQALQETRNWSEAQIMEWRDSAKKSKRWFEDVWG
ncbi:unnamed protein product [Clonostachys rosea]|uniref:NADPH--cytochrome P450 reductase n=1 Tax=Bionectria ochroleuca TaxID=29856 RepID=A0ABY6TQG9_BIOOC|nr:unnamed protein product [Clonostachys rosea]